LPLPKKEVFLQKEKHKINETPITITIEKQEFL
jgi:hypothetical protein